MKVYGAFSLTIPFDLTVILVPSEKTEDEVKFALVLNQILSWEHCSKYYQKLSRLPFNPMFNANLNRKVDGAFRSQSLLTYQ